MAAPGRLPILADRDVTVATHPWSHLPQPPATLPTFAGTSSRGADDVISVPQGDSSLSFLKGEVLARLRADADMSQAKAELERAFAGKVIESEPRLRLVRLRRQENPDVRGDLDRIARLSSVEHVQVHAVSTLPPLEAGQAAPGGDDWVARKLRLAEAWQVTQGTLDLTIALLDSGVNAGLPVFGDRVLDGRGFVDGDAHSGDENGHGTMLAGLLVGSAQSAWTGVAPGCRLLSVKVFDGSGIGTELAILRGLLEAKERGAQVVVMSFMGTARSRLMEETLADLAGAGIMLLAAAGNEGWDERAVYPACYDSVLAVGAVDRFDRAWPLSNRHRALLMAAPGVGVPGPGLSGETVLHSGTSVATALAAGVAALVRTRFPELSPYAATAQMLRGAFDCETPGRDRATGFGRLDAAAALSEAALRFHDVAIGSFTASDLLVDAAQDLDLRLIVENRGSFPEREITVTVTRQGEAFQQATIPRLLPGQAITLRWPWQPGAECDRLCEGEHHFHSYTWFEASVDAGIPEWRLDNNQARTGIAAYDDRERDQGLYLLQAANSPDKDFWADAPWRVRDAQTAIPFFFVLKDCNENELDQLRVLTIRDVSHPATPIVFTYNFNSERIGDNPQEGEFWVFATREAYHATTLADATPLTAANLGYGPGQDINFKVDLTFRDDYSAFVGIDETHTQYLRVHVGEEPWPRWDDWYYVDTHYHTMYTNNIAEWGGPPFASAQAGETMGLQYLCMTDHSCDLDEMSDGAISARTDMYEYTNWVNSQAVTAVQDNRQIGPGGTTWDVLGYEEQLHSSATFQILRNVELNIASEDPGSLDQTLHMLVFDNPEIVSALSGASIPLVAGERPVSLKTSPALMALVGGNGQEGFAYAAHPTDNPSSMVNGGLWGPQDYSVAFTFDRFRGLQGYNERPFYQSANQLNPWPDFDAKKAAPTQAPQLLAGWVANLDTHLSAQMTAIVQGAPRKLRWIAGSDAHMDFNYRAYLQSSLGEDAQDSAMGKARTLVYVPDPGAQWDLSALPPKQKLYEALRGGDAVATDGPLVRMELDTKNGVIARMAQDCVVVRGQGATMTLDYATSAEFGPVNQVDLYRGDASTGNTPTLIHSWSGGAVGSPAGALGPLNLDSFTPSSGLTMLPSTDSWVYFRAHIITTNPKQELCNGYTNPIWVFAGSTGVIPTITAVNPTTLWNDTASVITLTGTGFTGASSVLLTDGTHTFIAANVQPQSDTTLTATIPVGAYPAANQQLRVVTPLGSATSTGLLTVNEGNPTITSFTPTAVSDSAATVVSIKGAALWTTMYVKLLDPYATMFTQLTQISYNEVLATVPANTPPGDFRFEISNIAARTTSPQPLKIAAAPKSTGVTPNSGINTQDTNVTIAGNNLSGATRALLGGAGGAALANFTVVNDTTITATVPMGLASGVYSITVFRDAIADSGALRFTVIDGPVANAGPDQSVVPGTVTLDGSLSSDPAGGGLTGYSWTQTAGATVALSGAGMVKPIFNAVTPGTLTFSLVVSTAQATSLPDTVTITVNPASTNVAPVVVLASNVLTAAPGQTVTLDASASHDPNGDSLSFAWTENAANPVASRLSSTSLAAPTFSSTVEGLYRFTLVLTDGATPPLSSQPAPVTVTVSAAPPPNPPPVAGTNQGGSAPLPAGSSSGGGACGAVPAGLAPGVTIANALLALGACLGTIFLLRRRC